jgi:hypothetical protein
MPDTKHLQYSKPDTESTRCWECNSFTRRELVQAAMLLTYIREVFGSNLCRDTDLPDVRFFVVYLCPSRQMLGPTFKLGYERVCPHSF